MQRSSGDTEFVLGIDIGGTKVSAGLVDRGGGLRLRQEVPCPRHEGSRAMLAAALSLARSVLSQVPGRSVSAIGVCTAGWVDQEGTVTQTVSRVSGWEGTPLARRFAEAFPVPVCVLNDAHAAALGELRFGAGRGVEDFLLITLGTGIGGAVVTGGRLITGHRGTAGAIGHLTLVPDGVACRCGGRGCLERYVSGEAIAQLAELKGFAPGTDAKLLVELARGGDRNALAIWEETGRLLGHALVSAAHLLNPSRIIVAGALAEAGPLLFDPAEAVMRAETLPAARVELTPAVLGKDAGLVGIASEAWRRYYSAPAGN